MQPAIQEIHMRSNTLRSLASALALVATMQTHAQAQTGANKQQSIVVDGKKVEKTQN